MESTQERSLSPTIEQFLISLSARNLSPNTIRAYHADLAGLVEFLGPEAKASQTDRNRIRAFLVHLREAGLGRNSVYRKLQAIKTFYRWMDDGGLPHDARILNLTSPHGRDQIPDVPSEAAMMRLCDSAIVTPFPERDRVIPELLYGSGIRVSELVAVNLSDFKYKDALLVRGKGRKERMVPVTACAQSAIDAWLPVREQLLAKFNLKTDALLFRGRHENVAVKLAIQQAYAGGAAPTHRGLARHLGVSHGWISVVRKKLSQGMNAPKNGRAERLDVRSVRRILKATAKAKGLPDYHPHQLRHACGTHLHDNDVDLLAISRLLGHSRLATTQVYTRVSVGRMMRAYRTAHPHAQ